MVLTGDADHIISACMVVAHGLACACLQVRMEVSYRKQLFMPVTMEVHPANDQAHGKMEQWAPDSEKMQAELEGNRLSKTMNVSPSRFCLLQAGETHKPTQMHRHSLQTALFTSNVFLTAQVKEVFAQLPAMARWLLKHDMLLHLPCILRLHRELHILFGF